MDKIKVAKELVKLAKNLIALDEEGDGSGFQMQHDYENREQERLDRAEKEGKKYILHHKEHGLWRIQACKNFFRARKGDFGGLIQKEENLSHNGDCWVFNKSVVQEDAQVYDNAFIFGSAYVHGNAKIYGNARVYGQAHVQEDAQVYDNAWVRGKSRVFGDAQIFGNAQVFGRSIIHGNAKVDYDVESQEITK